MRLDFLFPAPRSLRDLVQRRVRQTGRQKDEFHPMHSGVAKTHSSTPRRKPGRAGTATWRRNRLPLQFVRTATCQLEFQVGQVTGARCRRRSQQLSQSTGRSCGSLRKQQMPVAWALVGYSMRADLSSTHGERCAASAGRGSCGHLCASRVPGRGRPHRVNMGRSSAILCQVSGNTRTRRLRALEPRAEAGPRRAPSCAHIACMSPHGGG